MSLDSIALLIQAASALVPLFQANPVGAILFIIFAVAVLLISKQAQKTKTSKSQI